MSQFWRAQQLLALIETLIGEPVLDSEFEPLQPLDPQEVRQRALQLLLEVGLKRFVTPHQAPRL